jgi:hypothetical protein
MMAEYTTVFGSLDNYRKGGVDVIDDSPKNYVFSNVFEVAAKSIPYERVAVAKNFQYVIEALRAEGTSPWFTCGHDEFVLCMDGRIEVHLVKLARPAPELKPGSDGAVRLGDNPDGRKMGRVILDRGHMALLPASAAYRFQADKPSVAMVQTIEGPVTAQKWAEICLS